MPKKLSASKIDNSQLDVLTREIALLRQELEALKSNPFLGSRAGQELIDAVYSLNNSIRRLSDIFRAAEKELLENYSGEHPGKALKKLQDQNKIIAEALVSIHNNVQGLKQTQTKSLDSLHKAMQELNQSLSLTMKEIDSLKQEREKKDYTEHKPEQESINTDIFQELNMQSKAGFQENKKTSDVIPHKTGLSQDSEQQQQKHLPHKLPYDSQDLPQQPLIPEKQSGTQPIQHSIDKQGHLIQPQQKSQGLHEGEISEKEKQKKHGLSLPPLPPLPNIHLPNIHLPNIKHDTQDTKK